MESHPVPKNVLTVEFKLFGPLTISQFVRILVSSLVGLGIFFLSPDSVRLFMLPVIAIIVGLGVMSALIEGFQTKVLGMLKAIFSSTQYVWQKQTEVPEVLQQEEEKEVKSDAQKKMESAETSLDDLSIEKILDARRQAEVPGSQGGANNAVTAPSEQTPAAENFIDYAPSGGEDYFNKVYQDVFADSVGGVRPNQQQVVQQANGLAGQAKGDTLSMGENMFVSNTPVQNNQPRSKLTNPGGTKLENTTEASVDETQMNPAEKQAKIEELTSQLGDLRRKLKTTDPNVRRQVTQEIKKLFDQIQELAGRHPQQEAVLTQSQSMFGVVVDKQNQPIPNAQVGLFSLENPDRMHVSGESSGDGRFSFDLEGLPRTSYVVKVSHPQFKFPVFRVDLAVESLPGFKFKAN